MKAVEGIKKDKKINSLLVSSISFMLCIIFILIHCYVRKIWLFGEDTLLIGDAGEQYIFFLSELWNKVHNGGSLFYSRHAGMGYDFYVNSAYYLCSPFNVIALLLPYKALETAAQGIMVLKWAFCSATMTYYVLQTKRNKGKQARERIAITIGLAYSLSRFLLGYMFCYIWYDVILLLPLLVLNFERMLEGGKWRKYYIFLTVCMFCNFYMAFMACIFMCILFVQEKWNDIAGLKNRLKRFLFASFLAALTSMAVILPCFMMQHQRYVEPATALKDIDDIVCRLWELVKGGYALRPLEGAVDNIPHLYMGMAVLLLLVVLPFVKNTVEWKCKKIGILFFFCLCFLVPKLNLLWHGGVVPHSFYQRFGFVVVFFVLQTCLELLPFLSQIRIRYYILAVVLILAVQIFAFFKETELYDFYVYFVTFMLTVFYGLLLVLYRKKSFTQKTFSYIMCSVIWIELFFNAYVICNVYQTESELGQITGVVLNELDEACSLVSGERIAYTDANVNWGMWSGKESVSGFLSFANGKLMKMMHTLGISGFENDAAVEYSGGTPIDNIIFNVAYGIGKSGIRFSDAKTVANCGDYSLFRINRTIGLGYMAEEAVSNWNISNGNVFSMRNEFAKRSSGIGDVFEIFQNDIVCNTLEKSYEQNEDGSFTYTLLNSLDSIWLKYTVPRDMDLYMYLNNSLNSIYTVYIDGEQVLVSDKTERTVMLHIGEVVAGQQIKIMTVVNADENLSGTIACQVAAFHEEIFQDVYTVLKRNTMSVLEYTDDRIEAQIDTPKDGVLVTSIQAVDGNQIYVDGRHISHPTMLADTFITIPLTKGEHKIVVEYQTPYWKTGIFLTIIGILVYGLTFIYEKKTRKA